MQENNKVITGEEISNEIGRLINRLEEIYNPAIFTLNKEINMTLEEIEILKSKCPHKFIDGVCIYCSSLEEQI